MDERERGARASTGRRAGKTHDARGDDEAAVEPTTGVVHLKMIHGGDFVTFRGFVGTRHTDDGVDLVPAPGATCEVP